MKPLELIACIIALLVMMGCEFPPPQGAVQDINGDGVVYIAVMDLSNGDPNAGLVDMVWGDRLQVILDNRKVKGKGRKLQYVVDSSFSISGANTCEIEGYDFISDADTLPDLLAVPYDVVILARGINDFLRGVPDEEIIGCRLTTQEALLVHEPDAQIFQASVPWLKGPNITNDAIGQLNLLFPEEWLDEVLLDFTLIISPDDPFNFVDWIHHTDVAQQDKADHACRVLGLCEW